jgi:hypothetical protein
MAVLAGNAGSFRISTNTVLELDNWTLDVSTGLEETQAFGDTWRERTATIRDWSGTASGRFDPADTNGHAALSVDALAGDLLADARFYINGTNYYEGDAFVQMSLAAAENGLITVSYTFTGSGALAYN